MGFRYRYLVVGYHGGFFPQYCFLRLILCLHLPKYCHLLEARVEISSPGIYDSICKGTIEEKARAVRDAIAIDFSLQSVPFYADDPESHKLLPIDQVPQSEDDWWAERLLRKGVPLEELEFLVQVLNPDPNERLSAEDIIRSGHLDVQKER